MFCQIIYHSWLLVRLASQQQQQSQYSQCWLDGPYVMVDLLICPSLSDPLWYLVNFSVALNNLDILAASHVLVNSNSSHVEMCKKLETSHTKVEASVWVCTIFNQLITVLIGFSLFLAWYLLLLFFYGSATELNWH